MKVVSIIGKGGGGKSTTAANLATVAVRRGFSVGLLDADPQSSLCQWRNARAASDIKVVPCARGLEELVQSARRAKLEWLIIDTAPELGEHTLAAVRSADVVLVPSRPANFDLGVTQQRIELLRTMGTEFGIVINAAPPRREGLDAPLVRETREVLRSVGARLWPGQITHRHAIISALTSGQGIIELEPDNPAADEYSRLWATVALHANVRKTGNE